jgi:hypothetical protein
VVHRTWSARIRQRRRAPRRPPPGGRDRSLTGTDAPGGPAVSPRVRGAARSVDPSAGACLRAGDRASLSGAGAPPVV